METIPRETVMEKLTPKERSELQYRLKYGPALSRNELVKYLLKIYEAKRAKEGK